MTSDHLAPTVTLANAVSMPALGLGTSPMNDDEVETVIGMAIQAGYRLFDTAENYGNERGVGLGVRDSGVNRAELFITTKFNAKWHGQEEVQQACRESAERLQVEYIDLLLIHWPLPAQDRYVDAWKGMVKLLEHGKVRAIGVSNFKPEHIDRLIDATGVAPHFNQVQLNPWIPRLSERTYNAAHGVITETWVPIAKGNELLRQSVIVEAAKQHSKTPAQVVLRWHVQLGLIPIPKTSNPERLVENLDVFDFALTEAEIAEISRLNKGGEGAIDSDKMGH